MGEDFAVVDLDHLDSRFFEGLALRLVDNVLKGGFL